MGSSFAVLQVAFDPKAFARCSLISGAKPFRKFHPAKHETQVSHFLSFAVEHSISSPPFKPGSTQLNFSEAQAALLARRNRV